MSYLENEFLIVLYDSTDSRQHLENLAAKFIGTKPGEFAR